MFYHTPARRPCFLHLHCSSITVYCSRAIPKHHSARRVIKPKSPRFPPCKAMDLWTCKQKARRLSWSVRDKLRTTTRKHVSPSRQEAARLDEAYGAPWPEKCGPLPPTWLDTLPDWAFARRDHTLVPRQQQIDELRVVHERRLAQRGKRRAASQRSFWRWNRR